MERFIPRYCACALAGALALLPLQAEAQVRSASRHAAEDQARAQHAERQRLDALFDQREMEAMMELGNGGLRGVMGYSTKSGRSLARMLSRASTAVADREWVFLLPMTPYIEAWYESNDRSLSSHGLKQLNPEVWKYAGRVRTDTAGNFEFSGLKPGRYLVFAEFPVIFETEQHVDTGQRSITYSYAFGTGSIDPVYRKVYGTHQTLLKVGQVVAVREGTTTTYRPAVD